MGRREFAERGGRNGGGAMPCANESLGAKLCIQPAPAELWARLPQRRPATTDRMADSCVAATNIVHLLTRVRLNCVRHDWQIRHRHLARRHQVFPNLANGRKTAQVGPSWPADASRKSMRATDCLPMRPHEFRKMLVSFVAASAAISSVHPWRVSGVP